MDLQKGMYDPNGRVAELTEKESKAFGITDRYVRTHTHTQACAHPRRCSPYLKFMHQGHAM